MPEKHDQKLYAKWWFWVIFGIMFVSFVFSTSQKMYSKEKLENELTECRELLDNLIVAWEEYDEAMQEYCNLDPTNLLCVNYP